MNALNISAVAFVLYARYFCSCARPCARVTIGYIVYNIMSVNNAVLPQIKSWCLYIAPPCPYFSAALNKMSLRHTFT